MQVEFKTLLESGSEINIMTQTYIAKLGLSPQKTNIRAQKIERSPLKMYEMTTAKFLI